MRLAASLSNRIFVASALLTALSTGIAIAVVNQRASAEAEGELRLGLDDAAAVVNAHRENLTDTFTRLSRLVADHPKLRAAVETGDPPTVQPLVADYHHVMNVDLLVVTGARGQVLAADGAAIDAVPAAMTSLRSEGEISTFLPHARGVVHVFSVPIVVDSDTAIPLGRLTVGVFLDHRLATRFKALTGSEIAFGVDDRILASTTTTELQSALATAVRERGIASVRLGGEDYLAKMVPLTPAADAASLSRPFVVVLRSRTKQLRFLSALRTGLAGALIVTILLATVLSYSIARTVTRPLAAVTRTMREVAATGDLTHKVLLRSHPWDDEDARILAQTFNALTESIARFQREASQRDRLSSLGRLSTVIAHEIRNPLMIIRATLSTLSKETLGPDDVRDAVADIDAETRRLNRLVTEVLDFARPIRFDLHEASVNDICRMSSDAAWAGDDAPPICLDLDASLSPIVTDAERLRTALVNILTNARYAARSAPHHDASARPVSDRPEPRVVVRTRQEHGGIAITAIDHGIGIAPEDMAHIFDPYFTTRRAGTGLGLPIAKNIIEGLGGRIRVISQAGTGTEVRIDLPFRPTEAQ